MNTKVRGEVKRFRFRVKPHEVMADEYPERYYKFKNYKVTNAFFQESCGNEIKVKQL